MTDPEAPDDHAEDPEAPDDPDGPEDHDRDADAADAEDPGIDPDTVDGDVGDPGETGAQDPDETASDPEDGRDGADPDAAEFDSGTVDPDPDVGDRDPDAGGFEGDPAGPTVERPDAAEDLSPVDGEEGEREGPLADVASDVERLRDRDPESIDPELFDEVAEEAEIDREALWRQVAGEETAERVAEMDPDLDAAAVTAPRIDPEDRTERIVEKQKYCQKCEYFSPPPEVHCTHDGTDIAELVDVDTFRVVDCPVVAEDEELERF